MAATKDGGFPSAQRDLTANASGFTWTGFTTPGTNRLVVAGFAGNGVTAATISALTSPNLTWTKRVTLVDSGSNYVVEFWTAWAASVVTTEVITQVDTGSPNYNRRTFAVWSIDGTDAAGVGNTGTADTTAGDPSVSVTATATGSLILGGLAYRSSGADNSVDANTTLEYNPGGGGGFGFNEKMVSRASTGAGAHVLGFTGDDAFGNWAMAALEIKAAAGGPAALVSAITGTAAVTGTMRLDLYSAVDETVAADADHIYSSTGAASDIVQLGLGPISTPGAGTVSIIIRHRTGS